MSDMQAIEAEVHRLFPGYHPYTTTFDLEVSAADIISGRLHELKAQLAKKSFIPSSVSTQCVGFINHAEKVRSALKDANGKQEPDWQEQFDDVPDDHIDDTALILLTDMSGGVRGQQSINQFMIAEAAHHFAQVKDIPLDICGYTTSQWKGGLSRKLAHSKEEIKVARRTDANLGRMNDMLNIVFQTSANGDNQGMDALARTLILDVDRISWTGGLRKEQVDGESVLWATSRLLERPEQRKILLVASDNAPCDDSTLDINRGYRGQYLSRHLAAVSSAIQSETDIILCHCDTFPDKRKADYATDYPHNLEYNRQGDLGAQAVEKAASVMKQVVAMVAP